MTAELRLVPYDIDFSMKGKLEVDQDSRLLDHFTDINKATSHNVPSTNEKAQPIVSSTQISEINPEFARTKEPCMKQKFDPDSPLVDLLMNCI